MNIIVFQALPHVLVVTCLLDPFLKKKSQIGRVYAKKQTMNLPYLF